MPFYVDFFAQSVKKSVSHTVKRLFPILSLIFCLLQYFNNYTAVVLTTFFGVVGVDRF